MANSSISHIFYDIEIEPVKPPPSGRGLPERPSEGSPEEIHLVKILSVDGRRFTYEVHAALTDDAVNYLKSLIDAVVFSDMIIERTTDGFEAREATQRLKKHS